MRCRAITASVIAFALAAAGAAPAGAQSPPVPEYGGITPFGSDVQHLKFKYGPITVAPGQNLILVGPVTIEKPAYDGYVISFKPDLKRADGSVPRVDVIHLHHGVWLNASRSDATRPGLPERFAASGEEKTIQVMPEGYGYPVKATDVWLMNHMVHNQTPVPEEVWITYDVDFVPADSELGKTLKPVRPIWLDVVNGSAYPVFDVKRQDGGPDGEYAYPRDSPSAIGRNRWTVDRDGTLLWAAGHVHPGGLRTEVDLVRGSERARIFTSDAEYFDPNGPVSWDMAMTATKPDWRVGVKRGDVLDLNAVYETQRGSWYESMGIVIALMADEQGPDPFASPPDTNGVVTHGHLAENDNHGGQDLGLPDPTTLPGGRTLESRVGITGFQYLPGGSGLPGQFGNPPVVAAGRSLRFGNADAAAQVFHTITACKAPCNRSTGISYPLADGDVRFDFDSGELGYGPRGYTAAKNEAEWDTPSNLAPGTYTYFCRVHPFMRGAFRVK